MMIPFLYEFKGFPSDPYEVKTSPKSYGTGWKNNQRKKRKQKRQNKSSRR